MGDITASLNRFVHIHSTNQLVAEPVCSGTDPYAFSFRAREVLLRILNSFTGNVFGMTIKKIYEYCDVHTSKTIRSLCRGGVRLAVDAHKNRLSQAHVSAGNLVERIENRLNEVNEQLTSNAVKLYAPRTQLVRSWTLLDTYSSLWLKVQSYQSTMRAAQRFLTLGSSN